MIYQRVSNFISVKNLEKIIANDGFNYAGEQYRMSDLIKALEDRKKSIEYKFSSAKERSKPHRKWIDNYYRETGKIYDLGET